MTIEQFNDKTPDDGAPHTWTDLGLVDGKELARRLKYNGMTSQCRAFMRRLGITPLPGRRDCYDLRHVRACLDRAAGLPANGNNAPADQAPLSLFDMWKSDHAA